MVGIRLADGKLFRKDVREARSISAGLRISTDCDASHQGWGFSNEDSDNRGDCRDEL
jgi:hypothetical protein